MCHMHSYESLRCSGIRSVQGKKMDYLDALGKIDDFERRNLPAYKNVSRHTCMLLRPIGAAQEREKDCAQSLRPRLKGCTSLESQEEGVMPTPINGREFILLCKISSRISCLRKGMTSSQVRRVTRGQKREESRHRHACSCVLQSNGSSCTTQDITESRTPASAIHGVARLTELLQCQRQGRRPVPPRSSKYCLFGERRLGLGQFETFGGTKPQPYH